VIVTFVMFYSAQNQENGFVMTFGSIRMYSSEFVILFFKKNANIQIEHVLNPKGAHSP
jgi:hypothetical protein